MNKHLRTAVFLAADRPKALRFDATLFVDSVGLAFCQSRGKLIALVALTIAGE
ncbi:hypothetical protein [Sinorhizobium sp. CCBAU 05631]|uniref:hypothetical protein n=1 Tax=Sinorhizobium sp. CCBAU 05631 TaxID=794846 RepID=UPI0012F8D866|nr:hypothetical protein [Sinorhizobium sp. CCBAU 05631]